MIFNQLDLRKSKFSPMLWFLLQFCMHQASPQNNKLMQKIPHEVKTMDFFSWMN